MKFILGIVSLFFIPGAAVSFYRGIIQISTIPAVWKPILVGIVVGILLYRLVIRRLAGLETFEHEFTHAIVAIMLFRRITRFSVTKREGGYVQFTGGSSIGNNLIGLAPYFLPTVTLFAVLIRPILLHPCFPWFDVFIGISFAYHTLSTAREIKGNYTKKAFRSSIGTLTLSDIGKVGYIFATLFIVCLTLTIHGIICFIICDGYSGVADWGKRTWDISSTSYATLHAYVRMKIGG